MLKDLGHSFAEQVGHSTLSFIEDLGEMTNLFRNTFTAILAGKTNPRLVFDQMVKIGIDSFPIATASALFVGMVFALQISTEFVRFGASKYIGGVMGIAVVRELAPALTGVVIASRVAAAIAAELGTMKVTQQIDAINALGSNPIKYLVIPRLIAATLMLPILTVFADVAAFYGGYFVAVYLVKINPTDYLGSAQQFLVMKDIWGGIFKSLIFGILIAIIACRRGLNTVGGAKGVGEATTSSVVTSLIALFIANYFLSNLLFK